MWILAGVEILYSYTVPGNFKPEFTYGRLGPILVNEYPVLSLMSNISPGDTYF